MGLCPAKQFGFFGQRSSPQRGVRSTPQRGWLLWPAKQAKSKQSTPQRGWLLWLRQIKSMHPLLLRAAEKRRSGGGHQWPFFIYKFNNDFVSRYFD